MAAPFLGTVRSSRWIFDHPQILGVPFFSRHSEIKGASQDDSIVDHSQFLMLAFMVGIDEYIDTMLCQKAGNRPTRILLAFVEDHGQSDAALLRLDQCLGDLNRGEVVHDDSHGMLCLVNVLDDYVCATLEVGLDDHAGGKWSHAVSPVRVFPR